MKYYYISYVTYENHRDVTHTTYRTDKTDWLDNIEWLEDGMVGVYDLNYHEIDLTQADLNEYKKQFNRTYIENAPLFIKRNPQRMTEWIENHKFNPDYIAFDNNRILAVIL